MKVPTGTKGGEIPIGTGAFGYGLSVSASLESFDFYGLWDVFTWIESRQTGGGQKGAIIGFDSDWGVHPYHDMLRNLGIFAMIGLNARWISPNLGPENSQVNTGGMTLEVVPTIVGYKDNVMVRAQLHCPVYQNLRGTQLAALPWLQLGVGVAFDSWRRKNGV